jgi:tRNA threonylcarbamoyl adenosine modification protein YeaZ
MIILALDMSGDRCSIGIGQNQTVLAESSIYARMRHLPRVMPQIDFTLNQAGKTIHDIDLLCAVSGPGSWTGIRIAITMIKTLGHVLSKPCVTVNSLAALACNMRFVQPMVYPIIDAARKQVYSAGFDCQSTTPRMIEPASLKKIEREIQNGRFREDLFFRLNVIPIEVPPLRERQEDISILVNTFLSDLAQKNKTSSKTISQDVLDLFKVYSWPGNVREMKNLLVRLVITVQKDTIGSSDIPAPYNPYLFVDTESADSLLAFRTFPEAQKAFEKAFVLKKLNEHDQSIDNTAIAIHMDPDRIRQILENT